MKKQLRLSLYVGILLLGRPVHAFQRKINVFSFKQPSSLLLQPYPIVTKSLQQDLHVYLAALLVVLPQNNKE